MGEKRENIHVDRIRAMDNCEPLLRTYLFFHQLPSKLTTTRPRKKLYALGVATALKFSDSLRD